MKLKMVILLSSALFQSTNSIFAQNNDFAFKHLTTDNGLSNSTINNIFQDSKGFIWISTDEGLNKFDGNEFTYYKNKVGDSTTINSNSICPIYEDKECNLWIGTSLGLNKYIPDQDKFIRVISDSLNFGISAGHISAIVADDSFIWVATMGHGLYRFSTKTMKLDDFEKYTPKSNACSANAINTIFIDGQDRFWIGTYDSGLLLLNRETGLITQYSFGNNNPYLNYVICIMQLSDNSLLIGTEAGLVHFFPDSKDQNYELITHDANNERSVSAGSVKKIFKDTSGKIWIAAQFGLDIFNEKNNSFSHVKADRNNDYSLSTDEIWTIMQDKEGTMWFGSYRGGINLLNTYQQSFKNWQPKNTNNSTSSSSVMAIQEDSDGSMWVGFDHGGLSHIDKNKETIERYYNNPSTKNSISSNNVLSLSFDKNDQLWIGTYGGGLNIFNKTKQQFSQYIPPKFIPEGWHIWDILEDHQDKLWTASSGNGLCSINPKTDEFKCFMYCEDMKSSLSSNLIWSLFEDSNNDIWVGTSWGLNKLKGDGSVTYYPYKVDEFNCSENFRILSIFEDSKHRIWVGIEGYGLNLLNPETKTFKPFSELDGLANNMINGILEDNEGSLWLSSNKGLTRVSFNVKNEISTIKNFNKSNGLHNSQFNLGASFKSKSGEMYFGNNSGFVYFNPDSIKTNTYKPDVYFTDFTLFNKKVQIDPTGISGSPLLKHISESKEITLTYKQSVFSIKYAALSYVSPENNQYAYMLEGFDYDWNYVGNKREVHYTNLDAGTYTFKVKASNNDGVWNECSNTLIINILPPWWETWWFKTIVVLFFIITTLSFCYARMKIMKMRQKVLEEKVRVRTAALQDANEDLKEHQEEIQQQNEELKTQKEKIEQNHKQITDSINYASRIQSAALPSPIILESVLNDHFIYFKPRDIVSGDFYWIRKINNNLIVVAADCTGHGVPGAFVSMLGISFLNEITQSSLVWKTESNASEILELLREKIKTALKQKGGNDDSKDGMDMTLCIIDLETKMMQFAGANNSMCIVRNSSLPEISLAKAKTERLNGLAITHIKPDMMPIGFYYKERKFTNNVIQLKPNDRLYLFSDGYIDQFGGEFGKKIMMGNFRKLLYDINKKPMKDQKQLLDSNLKKWMGCDYEQIDDILVIGLEI